LCFFKSIININYRIFINYYSPKLADCFVQEKDECTCGSITGNHAVFWLQNQQQCIISSIFLYTQRFILLLFRSYKYFHLGFAE